MKYFILSIVAILSCLTGIAQGGYNPENPGDPNPYRKLTFLASPKVGGTVNQKNDSQVGVGQTVSCYANENSYYNFVHWLQNGDIVSTESHYTFIMPDENVEMIAVFELNYNPENPEDPQEAKPSHRVTLTASPGKGGRFNNSVFKLCEGDSTNIYAYPNEGYRFEEWLLDGVLVSTKNPLMVKMTDRELNYTARFSYNPINPSDPAVNLFNPGTGEMVIDRFEQGYLSSAVSRLLGDDYGYSDIQSLLVSGIMDGSDFGIMYRLINCSVIDLSRTNGYSEIPSYAFESTAALTELILPSSINTIGRYAFQDCKNLSVLTCYAVIPPTLLYGVFDGVDKSVVIKVPAQSIDLYKNAKEWKDFTILPADENVYSISVTLPSDAQDGRYKNMNIELFNTSNGQKYKYLITDKTEYIFGNLLSSTTYSVSVKNPKGELLGEITDLEIVDKDLAISFQNLLQPCNISVKVLSPEGQDITNDVTIKWFNESNELLQQGVVLSGVLENSVVSYTVSLPQQLQNIYLQPASQTLKVSDSQSCICNLEAIGKCALSGKICDKENKPISTAIITISQNTKGPYSNSVNAHCDSEGNYNIEVPDVPVKITISANGYIGQTKELQSASTGIGDIVLEKNTGITVYPSYTFQESVANGKSETNWYFDDANIAYRILDSNGNEIPNCIYQAGSIILPESVQLDETVIVTVYSKNNKFKDVSQAIFLTSKSTYVNIPIVEYGGISVKSSELGNSSNICLLYDSFGKQVGKSTLRNNGASFANLPDGQYSLITMNQSTLLGSVQNLSSLKETPLEEGIDYILNEINVNSGQISEITIANVPNLDETKLYFTDSRETYFMSNKQQLTIGNYLTLKAKVTMKDEYADIIDAATLIVDIPTNCEFVDNSVISGTGYLGYEYSDNRLSIPIQRLSDAVRFCIVPLEGGECKPSAFVKLVIDNKEILQPIGSAYFAAKNFSLVAPQKTSKTSIAIRGIATPDSEVLIYDNETLVGSTYSMPNGQWFVRLSLHKPYSKSIHNLYGEVITKDGKRLLTQTKVVDYDQSYVDLSKVTMVYNNTNIVFDHLNGKNTANSYSYVPGTPDFTFIADFTENNPDKISNVVIKVLASDGTVRSLPAEYNSTSGNWVVRTKYADSNKLPVNATALYDLLIQRISDDQDRINQENNLLNEVVEYYITALNERELIIKNETENSCTLDFANTSNDVLHLTIRQISLDQIPSDDNTLNISLDNETLYLSTFSNNSEDVIYIWNRDLAYMISFFESQDELTTMLRVPSRAWWNNWGDFGRVIIRLPNSVPILGNRDLVKACDDYNYWENRYLVFMNNHIGYNKLTTSLLLAKCDDGGLKLSKKALEWYEMDKRLYYDNCSRFEIQMREMLDKYRSSIWWRSGISAGLQLATLGASYYVGKSIGTFVHGAESLINWLTKSVVGQITTHIAGSAITGAVSGIIGDVSTDTWVGNYLARHCEEEERKIRENYIELNEKIKNSYRKCPKEKEDDEEDEDTDNDESDNNDFPAPPTTPSIDPSGYVYEAVPSNRIPGVTATAYFKQQSEDIYGDISETAVVWDAVPFGQENPLITDAQGMYAWDVPAGMWQVRFEKEGYGPAQSAWLPVPPPQLDVNIAITQAKQPEVKAVHAYSDGVKIEFDKFMLPLSLSVGNIAVTQNGEIVNGTIEALDIELDANGNSFCSKVEFKPTDSLEEGEASLFVSKAVKSYANINMSEDFMQTFTVEPRISEIKVNQNIEINSGSTIELFATVLPETAAKGKIVLIESLNPLIASVTSERTETDENGIVSFDVTGLIPGNTSIKLSIEDYDIEVVVNANVLPQTDEKQVSAPYASVESGEVTIGTEIYLYCETENASIYYTIDGSCPCDENGTRIKYTKPIVVTDDMKIIVLASIGIATDEDVSETVEFNYTLKRSVIDFQMAKGWTWISHNFYRELDPMEIAENESISRILSQTDEVIRDPEVGMIGTLTELSASESYKVETSAETERQRISDVAWNPATPISINSGWNWLGYPVAQTMSVDEALAPTEAEPLDIIVGQNGFAQFDGDSWTGTLEVMSPGMGYMYHSQSAKDVVYNTSIVSIASAKHVAGIAKTSPLVLDIHKYGTIMPVVATIIDNAGSQLDNEDYQVAAFCGTECRGIGRVVKGLVMMNVYGNPNDNITFMVTDTEGQMNFTNDASLKFSETVVGNIFDPYVITINETSGIENVDYNGTIKVSVEGDMLRINGIAADDINLVEIYDLNGQKLIRETRVSESGIRISALNNGVYVVIVNSNGEYTYHKIALSK